MTVIYTLLAIAAIAVAARKAYWLYRLREARTLRDAIDNPGTVYSLPNRLIRKWVVYDGHDYWTSGTGIVWINTGTGESVYLQKDWQRQVNVKRAWK